MSVLVLGLASYPSIPPNLNQDITNDFQLPLGNFAFAQEKIEITLEEKIGISGDVEAEEDEEEKVELKGKITGISDTSFTLETEDDGICTINTDGNTKFENFAEFSVLKVDDEVEVEGTLTEDCVLLATEIEFEEENGEDGNGGPPGDKTVICHVPPGNPSKAHTITIGDPAVSKHIAHGDYVGSCDGEGGPMVTAEVESLLGGKQAEREARLAEKEARLAEKQIDLEVRLAEKESQALQRAEDLIQKLEQRITDLEQRLQTLLKKVETGEYFGNIPKIDPVFNSYSISIDGMASSLFDESVTTAVSGEIFIENLVTTSKVSKFKVTGGEIFVGDNIYDVVFGKARISSTGPSGEKDSMVLILQAIDSVGNGNTIRLSIDFDSALEGDFGTEPIELEIIKNSKISGQWSLSASGQLSLLQA
ncbi:MAG: hypothetical protein IH841_04035 [Thaumarchaeota archaeon]|nr:hypothetical protein [Nitrososphaerota archaeon]